MRARLLSNSRKAVGFVCHRTVPRATAMDGGLRTPIRKMPTACARGFRVRWWKRGTPPVAPLPNRLHYLQALLQREAVARATRKGLWQNPAYAIRDARDTQTLTQLTGTFQIIEGWVVATGASRREVFLNFGRNWRWDFTAAVVLPRGGDSAALSTRLKALEGRYVGVSGWLVKRNGPFIALAGAEAIEELPEGLGSADMR